MVLDALVMNEPVLKRKVTRPELVLWNVDTQKDFMWPSWIQEGKTYLGKLVVPDAREIEGNLAQLCEFARQYGPRPVSPADWHTRESREIVSGEFPEHCIMGTPGAEYIPATAPINPYVIDWRDDSFDLSKLSGSRETVILKDEFSCFEGSKHTEGVIEALRPTLAVVYGVAANVCVNLAATGLKDRGLDVVIVEDAVKELPDELVQSVPHLKYDNVRQNWQDKGIVLATTGEVLKYIKDSISD